MIKHFASQNFGEFLDFVERYAWAVELVIAFFLTLAIAYAEHIVYHKVRGHLGKHKKVWQNALVYAIHKPFFFFIWLLGLTFALGLALEFYESALFYSMIAPVRKVGVWLLLTWFSFTYIQEIEKILTSSKENRYHVDRTTARAVGQVLKILVLLGGLFFVLQTTLGVGASAIWAFAGGGSFIIGWAAKDMLANIFGGFMIFVDRPFVIGDKISSVDGQIEGYVEHIGWRLTCVRTMEKVPIYIPNSFFSSMSIQNPSRMSHRRIQVTIGLRYCDADKMEKILLELRKMLEKHPDLDHDEPTYANFVGFGTSSLDILINGYTAITKLESYYNIRQDVYFRILEIIKDNKAMCAYPTTEGRLVVALEQNV